MNVGIRCYIGVNLLAYSNNVVVVVEALIIALPVEDEIDWVEITTNVWYVV